MHFVSFLTVTNTFPYLEHLLSESISCLSFGTLAKIAKFWQMLWQIPRPK